MPGQQPPVRAAASQIASAVKEHGFLTVYAYPDLDSCLAAGVLLAGMRRQGVDVEVVVAAEPPEAVEEPAVLVGYPVEVAEELEARGRVVVVARGQQPTGLTRVPVLAHDSSSATGLTVSLLSELMVTGELGLYALVAGYWRGLDSGKKAEFTGIEASITELLAMEGLAEGGLTLRLFRWFEAPVETSLEITLDPLIPGLTGRREAVERLLSSDPRLSRLRGVSVKDAGEEPVTALATRLYEELKRVSRVARRPSEVIGYSYYTMRLPVHDLRELAYLLAGLASTEGLAYAVAAPLSPGQVVGYAHYHHYARLFPRLVEEAETVYSRGRLQARRLGPIRVAVAEDLEHILPLERQLKLLGVAPADAALAAPGAGGLTASMESLQAILPWRRLREALRRGCVAYEPGSPYGVLVEQQCSQL